MASKILARESLPTIRGPRSQWTPLSPVGPNSSRAGLARPTRQLYPPSCPGPNAHASDPGATSIGSALGRALYDCPRRAETSVGSCRS
jgi:hypothetical protein